MFHGQLWYLMLYIITNFCCWGILFHCHSEMSDSIIIAEINFFRWGYGNNSDIFTSLMLTFLLIRSNYRIETKCCGQFCQLISSCHETIISISRPNSTNWPPQQMGPRYSLETAIKTQKNCLLHYMMSVSWKITIFDCLLLVTGK